RDARHDYDLSWCCAVSICRVRKFCCTAANRRARHDISKGERGKLLGVRRRWRGYVDQFLCARRSGQEWLDLLRAVVSNLRHRARAHPRIQWPDALVDLIFFSHHVVIAWRSEFHPPHLSIARQRTDGDAAAFFCVGAICPRVSIAAGIPAARGCNHHAANGSTGAYQLFLAGWLDREWHADVDQRRRQPASLAAFALGPPAPPGL